MHKSEQPSGFENTEPRPFMEHKDGKVFVRGVEKHFYMEHKDGKHFIQGKEVETFSEIDAWGRMNIEKSPEDIADRFIRDAQEAYKGAEFFIGNKNGKLRLELVRPSERETEWYSGKDPMSRRLLVEHYRKMKEHARRFFITSS